MKSYKVFLAESKFFIRWIIISVIIGILAGSVGALFNLSLKVISGFRDLYPAVILGLPIGGLAIVYLGKVTKDAGQGTNLVIEAIHNNEQLQLRMTPVYYLYTIITHLFTGGCGKEGTSLQIGGSIGNKVGNAFCVNEKNKAIATMCGMSAAFAALLGTPITAAIFSMEIASVGIMYYAALLPCSISALIGFGISRAIGAEFYNFPIIQMPSIDYIVMFNIIILGIICAIASMLFCGTMHKARFFFGKYCRNKYIGIFVGGTIVVLLTILLQNQDYMGSGMRVIEKALNGQATMIDLLLKVLLTSIILGVGYKGGEIIPALFIGAILGCCVGRVMGMNPSLWAALGMMGLFCGITNCPLASLLLSMEFFGYVGVPCFLLVVGVSYMLSGYSSLYKSQKILHSKVIAKNINRQEEAKVS